MRRQGMLEPGATNAAVGDAINRVLAAWVEQQSRDPGAQESLDFLTANFEWLNDWQADFATGASARKRLTPQIVDTLAGIVAVIEGRQARTLIGGTADGS